MQSSLIARPQTSSTFLRICADPSADICIVLVRFLIPICSKWPASFFDTDTLLLLLLFNMFAISLFTSVVTFKTCFTVYTVLEKKNELATKPL